MHDAEDIVAALQTVRATFNSLAIRYFIGGSVASSFHGAARSTMDVDVVADLQPKHIAPILAAVADEFYASESAIRSAVQRRSSFNLIHLPTSFKVDVFVNRGRDFDESSFARSSVSRLGSPENGIEVPVASVEDIILAKLDWYREGNEASERQWEDVTRLVKLAHKNLNWKYLESIAQGLHVDDLLGRLKDIAN
jgi:hypothetical protein